MDDLYSIETKPDPRSWRRACGGNTGDSGTDESCVEIAPIPLHPDTYAVRDTKNRAAGELRFTKAELDAFAADWTKSGG